jgi:comEA protein
VTSIKRARLLAPALRMTPARAVHSKEDQMFRTALSILALSLVGVLAAAPPVAAQRKAAAEKPAAPTQPVNINTATATDFEALPGVGPKLAARIVEYRQKNGPFKKVEDLMNVRGLGEKNFLKLKAQLTLGAQKGAERAQQ